MSNDSTAPRVASPAATRPDLADRYAHRLASSEVTVLGPDGAPFADREVTVSQRRHEFLFGCIGFDFIAHANGEDPTAVAGSSSFFGSSAPAEQVEDLAHAWFELFNTTTLPFYWGEFEPRRGQPGTRRLLQTARWFADRGVTVKGHPLTWHTAAPDWLLDLPTADVVEAQRARIRREVGDFAGLVDTWDVVNESVIMPVYDKYDNGLTRVARDHGRTATLAMAFAEARDANPGATLLLNDFDMSPAYERVIEEALEAGVGIDVLGLQSHMHKGYWGEERTLEVLGRFSRFGLPLHFTENTLVSGELMPAEIGDLNDHQVEHWPSTPEGEERQADEIVRHVTTLVSHPAVGAINYWGLSDATTWLGAPVGLVRADGTRKPSYEALHGLVKGQWWLSPTTVRTDARGRVQVHGFRGGYEVAAAGATAGVVLDGRSPSTTARLGGGSDR
ncbi:endo-1,4-beta-xylanase [Kineococcus sp. GCM10028916]|uniref:endo-1,4-beta-xylanase n=1 Tax=Kineococcus sp. GCM10028916 TaxID=3273394 RepID=UPI003626A809